MQEQKPVWSDWFYYDETSPTCLRWKVDRYRGRPAFKCISAGDVAGTETGAGYFHVTLNYKAYLVHRVVWELQKGGIPRGFQVDHQDGCRTNNKIENLRIVTHMKNSRNVAKGPRNTSGKVGVYLATQKRDGREYQYATAFWFDMGGTGKRQSKGFSVLQYGEEEAWRLASEYRDKKIKEMNENGAGYTERHGA